MRLRMKQFLRERNEFSPDGEETLLSVSEYYGVKPRAEAFTGDEGLSRADNLSGYRIVRQGDLVMNYMLAWKGAYGVSDHDGIVSPAYSVFVPDRRVVDERFLHHWFRSEPMRAAFTQQSKGIIQSRWRLYPDALLRMDASVPDLPTQKAIAAFLDRETARIDQLVEKKQRLVELLGERDDAAVNSAVETLGRTTKLKRHVHILPGYAFKSDDFTENPDDIRLLRGINIMPGALRWDEVRYWPNGDGAQFERFKLRSGDIVMGMDRPWVSGGMRVAQVTDQDVPALLLQRVCKIAPRATLYPDFLLLLLRSRLFLAHFEPILTGVSVPHISGDQIGGFSFGYVSVEQQKVRAETALLELRRSHSLRLLTLTSIDRLKEYRSALITAAVTGQIDVETWSRRGEGDRRLDLIEEEMAG